MHRVYYPTVAIEAREDHIMHPETAKALVAQHRNELTRDTASGRRGSARRLFPRWHVTWTRTILAPAGAQAGPPAAASGPAGRARRRGSSLVIIITAHRAA
jgi:hypothetical protein